MKRRVALWVAIGLAACHPEPRQPSHDARHNAAPFVPATPVAETRASGLALASGEYTAHELTALETQISAASELADAGAPIQEPVHPFQQKDVLKRPAARESAARRNANLSPLGCARELKSKKYPFKRVGALKGVATPVRVDAEIEGVTFRVPGSKSKFGVLDCRLALTLVDFARFLKSLGVVAVTVDNFYRPNARLPSRRSKRSQHAYGLAIDLTSFTLADGRTLHVESDWGAGIETEPCGLYAAILSPTSNTLELRELVCKLVEQQIFHHHLTPSYDLAHRNHLHLDVKRDEPMVTAR